MNLVNEGDNKDEDEIQIEQIINKVKKLTTFLEINLSQIDMLDEKQHIINNGYEHIEQFLTLKKDVLTSFGVNIGHSIAIENRIKELKILWDHHQQSIDYFKGIKDRITIEILLLGDMGVGKSSLINRYREYKFDEHYHVTKAWESIERESLYADKTIVLRIVDTAGQDAFFKKIDVSEFSRCYGVLAICSPDMENSVEQLENTFLAKLRDYNSKCGIVLVCNKCEEFKNEDEIIKIRSKLNRIASKNRNETNKSDYDIVYTSSKTGWNVCEAFDVAISRGIVKWVDAQKHNQGGCSIL